MLLHCSIFFKALSALKKDDFVFVANFILVEDLTVLFVWLINICLFLAINIQNYVQLLHGFFKEVNYDAQEWEADPYQVRTRTNKLRH